MKISPVMITAILAFSTFGYGLASAQTLPQHCTASTPCQRICGDHVCAPGEVYPPTNATTTKPTVTTTNATTKPTVTTPMGISANVTVTKITNATTTAMNQTKTVPPPVPTVLPPLKQMASGIAPSHVQCKLGYQLVLNKFDSRPACVSAEVLAKLVARGWAS